MNREQEHHALREDLDATFPIELESVLAKAQNRAKKRKRIHNYLVKPLSSIAAIFIIFVATVNIFPATAIAMEDMPGLRRLVAAVSFSTSLREVIEHGFVQDMDLEQIINGVTMRVEHLILDGRQLHIFYSLESATHYQLGISISMFAAEDGRGAFQALMLVEPHMNEDSLRYVMTWFDDEIPNVIIWSGNVLATQQGGTWPGEVIGEYSFTLALDSSFIGQAERIALDYDFILDGQSLTLATVDINPSNTQFSFSADEENTAWLRRLEFHMVNENGERIDPPTPAAGARNLRTTADTMMMDVHFLESAFFTQSERLYIIIEEVSWLDKDMEFIQINLAEGTSDPLPEGMQIESIEQEERGWILTFSTYEQGEYQLHRIIYTKDPTAWDDLENPNVWDGMEIRDMFRRMWDGSGSWFIYEDTTGLFFDVENSPRGTDSIVTLVPQYSRTVRLETPIKIQVR